ncbi:hypothetical protein M2167_005414 [Streptomyces sp. SPB4]|nr:hypothetical protein [Streptomyces sp. SPB4]
MHFPPLTTITGCPSRYGMHPHTAYAWAQYAQTSWAEHLEAAQATESRVLGRARRVLDASDFNAPVPPVQML